MLFADCKILNNKTVNR